MRSACAEVNLKFSWTKFCFIFAIVLSLSMLFTRPSYAEEQVKNILLLNSYNKGLTWTDEQVRGMTDTLSKTGINLTISEEYMDWKRYPEQINIKHLREYLKYKYQGKKFDLILTTDDAALEFAINNRQQIFSNAPIVFSGVMKNSADVILQNRISVTGVYESVDPLGTMELALRTNSGLKNVYVLHDNTESGISAAIDVKQALARVSKPLKAHFLNNLNISEILQTVEKLNKDSIVLLTTYNTDADGLTLEPDKYCTMISKHSAVPVYANFEYLLGKGALGGSLLSSYLQGEHAAHLAIRILQGEPIASIPIEVNKTVISGFDYLQLQRFNIAMDKIPENSRIINKPFSFFETYRILVFYVSAAFLVLIGLILYLVSNSRRRKKAELEIQENHQELTLLYSKLANSEEKYRLVAESANDSIWDWDLIEQKRYYADKLYTLLGYEKEELVTIEDWNNIIHPADLKLFKHAFKDHLVGKTDAYLCKYRVRCKDGGYKWILARGKALFDEQGKAYRVAGSYTDITESLAQEQKIHRLAYYEALTGLPNRVLLKDTVEEVIGAAADGDYLLGMFFIDLDDFKFVNDSYGHLLGDELLVVVGERITSAAGSENVVSRLGGDEFVVLLKGITDRAEVQEYANRLMQVMEQPIYLQGNCFYVHLSIGIAMYPIDGSSFDELLKNADTALYKSKELGKRKYTFFDMSMNAAVVEKIKIENSLRNAIDNKEFMLYYQPQLDLKKGTISGFEALIRWNSPDLGLIPPDRFIRIAEETGLIVPIGEWVVKTACTFLRQLHAMGYGSLRIAVNVSIIQLMHGDFVESIATMLRETGLWPEYIELELTETVLMESFEITIEKLRQLRAKGIDVSIDDFGRGYSSLAYLTRLPISTLKIDKSFLEHIKTETHDKSIAESIIVLAHQLGLKVIAEGVETKEQLDYLIKRECDCIQGYLVSRPVPEEEVHQLLANLNYPGILNRYQDPVLGK